MPPTGAWSLEDAIDARQQRRDTSAPYTPLASGFNYEKLGVVPRPVSEYR